MADTILAILKHYFKMGFKDVLGGIREVNGNKTLSEYTAQNWIKYFKVL